MEDPCGGTPVEWPCILHTRYTNYLFNGHEACDCFEFGGWAGPVDVNNATENRIYLNGDADSDPYGCHEGRLHRATGIPRKP